MPIGHDLFLRHGKRETVYLSHDEAHLALFTYTEVHYNQCVGILR